MAWTVERYYRGSVGYKTFDSKEEAEAWLNSDKVKEDEEYGMSFRLVEVGQNETTLC